ncbi:MAG: tyrosine-type recombinase/integrase [Candidatus Tectimicrobiota bacterium]
MFALAEQWELRPQGSNPCRGIARYRERKMERYLTTEELARLGAVLAEAEAARIERPAVLVCLRLLLLTGARLGEVLGLRWQDLDLERAQAFIPDAKTGDTWLRLSQATVALLRRLGPTSDNPYVLPGKIRGHGLVNLNKPWARLWQRAGLDGVRLHDLRHTSASLAAGEGLSLPIIGAMLGHRHQATTARYAHLAPDPVQQATEQVGALVARALGG